MNDELKLIGIGLLLYSLYTAVKDVTAPDIQCQNPSGTGTWGVVAALNSGPSVNGGTLGCYECGSETCSK